jgi:DENN (AEX-3) domain
MPYCLTYLSHYPLFDLMSDYLRCTWILYGKDPDKFNSNGVLRLMRIPPPQPDQCLRIALDNYTLCYQMPSKPTEFQNFSLWPLFSCLSPRHAVAIIEAALSPQGRIIFTSQHPAILTTAAETVRHYVKNWVGLYEPVVYGRYAQDLIDEPAPYILGVTKQSRSLFTAPRDALLVDLDYDRIFTVKPPGSLSPRQRTKYAAALSQALSSVDVGGVPKHLTCAFDRNFRFSATGTIIGSETLPRSVKDPNWWNPDKVTGIMSDICGRVVSPSQNMEAVQDL